MIWKSRLYDPNPSDGGGDPKVIKDPNGWKAVGIVNGREVEWDLAKLMANAQKEAAGDEKLRLAAEKQDLIEKGEQWEEFKEGLANKDAATLTRTLKAAGLDDQTIQVFLYGAEQEETSTAPPAPPAPPARKGGRTMDSEEVDPIITSMVQGMRAQGAKIGEIEKAVQSVVGLIQQAQESRNTAQFHQEVGNFLDKDQNFGRMLGAADESIAGSIRQKALEFADRRATKMSHGPALYKAVIEDLKSDPLVKLAMDQFKAVEGNEGEEDWNWNAPPATGGLLGKRTGLPGAGPSPSSTSTGLYRPKSDDKPLSAVGEDAGNRIQNFIQRQLRSLSRQGQ